MESVRPFDTEKVARWGAQVWSHYLKSKGKPSQSLLYIQSIQRPYYRGTTPKHTAPAEMCDWLSSRSGAVTSHRSPFGITLSS